MNASRLNTPIPNCVALFVAFAGLAAVVLVGYSIARSTTARRWPTTTGTVLDSRVTKVNIGKAHDNFVPRAQVRFRYEVHGTSYESKNVNFMDSAPELAIRYPVGAAISVSYDPTDPAHAVSDPSGPEHAYFKLIGGLIMFIAGAYYLATHPIRPVVALVDSDALQTTGSAISYKWHTVTKRDRYIISALSASACIWVAIHAHTTTLVLISVAFALGAVGPQIEQRVRIDLNSRGVSREITLWRLCLWSSRRSLDDFCGIGVYRLPSGTPQAPADLVHVGLRSSTGSILAIRYFTATRGQPCPEAQAFARSLEETTHLKFHGVA
jgi:hypothetical protein